MLRIACFVVVAASLVPVFSGDSQPGDVLKQADLAFQQKTYSQALALYQRADRSKEFAKHRDRIRLRVGLCLARLNRKDEALATWEELARSKPGTVVAAGAQVESGVLSLSEPHYYYAKDGKKHWGTWVQGATYRYTGTDDLKRGLRDLESASRILEGLAAEGLRFKPRQRKFATIIALHRRCFLEWAVGIEQKRKENQGLVPKNLIVADDAYGGLGTWNERLAWVFDRALDVQVRAGDRNGRALAGYMKGLAFARLLRQHRKDKPAAPPGWNPVKILQKTLIEAKGLKLADDILFALGKTQQEQGLLVDAVASYKALIDGHPASIWVQDCRNEIEQITFPRISVEAGPTRPVGRGLEVGLSTRNVKDVHIRIYKFPYRWIFENSRIVHDAELTLSNVERILKRMRTSPRGAGEVAGFHHQTPEEGRHRSHQEKVALPRLEKGGYLVEASGKGVTYRDLLIVSDLGVIRHVDRDQVIVFATNAQTGEPVAGAEVLVRERRWGRRIFGRGWTVTVHKGKTGADGTWTTRRAFTNKRGSVHIGVAAWIDSEAAIVPDNSYWTPARSGGTTKVHVFTDRPVYRPGDEIQFSAILREESQRKFTNLPGERVTVQVRNPKRTTIFDQVLKTDESGALHQSIVLGDEPPLGRYSIIIKEGKRTLGTGWLRVEEYKKPEYEVSVNAPGEQIRLGGKASVSIQGRYYFGAPVAGGKVEYRIFRETFRAAFHRREAFAYLYGSIPRDIDPSDRGRGRELVKKGSGQLDEEGQLRIEWETAAFASLTPARDSVFVVQVDVTDSSRRTISGAGRVPVTKTAFLAEVTADRGFYKRGENVTLEFQTQTPAGVALASSGKCRIYRVTQIEGKDGKPVELLTQILEEDASTDKNGIGFHTWTADEAGRFVVSYQAEDRWGEIVRADIPIWVQAPGFKALDFELRNLRIRTDKRVYREGETASVLLTSNFADSSVLLCVTAGYQTLQHQVVRLDGKALAIDLPITKAMTPNVFIQAFSTRDGGYFAAHHELLIPPVDQLLNVSLAFNKSEYKPGEKGSVTVSVKDDAGQPVAARVALTAYDASLLYIQKDRVADIRKHFYGTRRGRSTSGRASHKFDFQGYIAADADWGEYELRGLPQFWYRAQSGLVSRIFEQRGFGKFAGLFSDGAWGEESVQENGEVEESAGLDMDNFEPQSVNAPAKKAGVRRSRGFASSLPASAARPRSEERLGRKSAKMDAGDDAAGGGEDAPGEGANVRTDFRDTAVWAPDVLCGADGTATIQVPFPESLTRWHARALAWTGDTRVGEAQADAVTSKDLLVRLQAPRFFIEGDRIIVSAVVNNRTDSDMEVDVSLQVAGDTLKTEDGSPRRVTVKANADVAIDWWTKVVGNGEAEVTVRVESSSDSDAMRLSFPVLLWGTTKTLTATDILTGGGKSSLAFELPAARNIGASRLRVTVQPSLAATMLDALPYLISYPYGCTEQTTSRFIPAVAASLTLKEMGTSLEAIASQRRALPQAAKLAIHSPVVSDRRLNDIVAAGLRRLSSLQHGDGGFGWWKSGRSSPYMTAYALTGLLIARDAGYNPNERMIKRALAFLEKQAPKLDNMNTATYVSLVLARAGKAPKDLLISIYRNRDDLAPYGRALLASALAEMKDLKRARIVVQNLADSAQEDAAGGTVHWGGLQRRWRWWNNTIETNAAVLQALLDVDPKNRFVQPLVKWLVTNRKGNRWTNTRDTATCVLALCRYAKVSGELDPDYKLTVAIGPTEKTFHVTRKTMFAFDNVLELRGDALGTGKNEVTVTQTGRGRAYVTARMAFFTREDEIKGAGHELLVARRYFKIKEVPVTAMENGRKVTRLHTRRTLLAPGAQVTSGTIVEVELEVTARNDFEYLLFEDMKPAGFEPLQLRSGRSYNKGVCSNTEFRDERTAFFVTWLQQGTHKLTYQLRAEIPGTLRAPPARGECMYSPEYGGITDSFKFVVKDGESR